MNQFIITHETVVLDTDFEKCQLTGFVELTVSLQKEHFYIKQPYHDSNFNRISVNLPVLETESFTIHEVTVDGYSAKYEKRAPYLRRINKNFSDIADLHNFETLFLSNVADVMDYGELMITIPSQLLETKIPSLNTNGFTLIEPMRKKRKLSNGYHAHNHNHNHNHSVPKTEDNKPDDTTKNGYNYDLRNTLLEPFIVKIAFTAADPMDGIHWIVPRDSNGTPSISPSISASHTNTNSRESSPNKTKTTKKKRHRFGAIEHDDTMEEQKKNEVMYADRKCHMYSYNIHWMPCLNGLKHRCTYTLQLSVPLECIAICNGDLRVSKSNVSSSKSIFIYDIKQAILARDLMFAVGPFKEIVLNDILPSVATTLSPSMYMNRMDIDDEDDDEDDEDEDDNDEKENSKIKKETTSTKQDKEETLIKLYVLDTDVSSQDDVTITCFNINRILSVYSAYLELSFPFCTLSVVFVDEAYSLGSAYLNVNILSSDLIHNELSIEASYSSNDVISRCIADNWMNCLLSVSNVCDSWIKTGLSGLLHREWLSIFEGENELEYRCAMWRTHREEKGAHPHEDPKPPLSWNGYLHETQLCVSYCGYFVEKSMFVMRMLQQLIGSQSFKRNIVKHVVDLDSDKRALLVTTHGLEQHLCGIYAEKQISSFFRHFVYGDCCPKICAEYEYKAKDKRHLLCIKQEGRDSAYCNVIGTLKIVIGEVEHEQIEYIEIPSGEVTSTHEFVCRSRAKRKHKNGDNEAWMEAPANNDTPVKLVRIDPDYEMLFHFVFFIVDHKIAITQLLHDDVRDVKSQIEAIYSLRFVPSKHVSEALLQTLNDEMNYYKVRLEAAKALAQDRNPATLDENKTELINIIHKYWNKMKCGYYTTQKDQLLTHYFLIKHIVAYLSNVSQHKYPHYTPIEVVQLITTLLKQLIDDKLSELAAIFDIEPLTASIIENLGNIRVSIHQYGNKLDEIVSILSQILSLQRLFKSPKGMLRAACLSTFAKLYLNHPQYSNLYLPIKKMQKFAKYGKFHDNVRLTAFKIMVSLICDCKKNIKRCLQIVANEKVPGIRLKMIQIWAETNRNTDYFNKYEEMADDLHRVQHNTIQSLSSACTPITDHDDITPPAEEKLGAINLRPTLRGYLSKNFIKHNKDTTLITQTSFLDAVLRSNKPQPQASIIAKTMWSMLLKSMDQTQYEKYEQKHQNMNMKNNNYKINCNAITKSMDIMFAMYDLYKSIWAFKHPPFFDPQIGAELYADEIGNQKRVHDAVQTLKANFNNKHPQFCSFGVQFCT